MTKKILIICLVILMLFSFVSCKKAVEKAVEGAAEKAFEDALEKNSDDDVKVEIDIDDDKMEIKTEDGSMIVDADGVEWPDEAPDFIPVYKGKLIAVTTMGGVINATTDEATEDGAKEYIEEFSGWEEVSVMSVEGMISNTYSKDGYTVTIIWTESENILSVMIIKEN